MGRIECTDDRITIKTRKDKKGISNNN